MRLRSDSESACSNEELQHGAPETLDEKPLAHQRQGDKRSVRTERPIGDKHMHVRIEVGQVSEDLRGISVWWKPDCLSDNK